MVDKIMVANVELVVDEGGCGMSLPVPSMNPEAFRQLVGAICEHAIDTLTRLGKPLVFVLYCDPKSGLAGWRA